MKRILVFFISNIGKIYLFLGNFIFKIKNNKLLLLKHTTQKLTGFLNYILK